MPKNKRFIETLYEMSAVEDGNAIPKFDKNKLKTNLNSSKLIGRNKDIFKSNEPRFETCLSYNPCVICDKCQNKASHLYVKCQLCLIPMCTHTHNDRVKMIKRWDSTINVTDNTKRELRKLFKKIQKITY